MELKMKSILISLMFIASFGVQAGHHEGDKAGHHEGHQDPKSVVMQAYETFSSGDTDAWAALHADDLVFTVFGNIASSGKHLGREAVIQNVFEPISVHWPKFKITPMAYYTDGNMVFVHSKMTADNLDTETMHMFKVENGIIQTFTAFDDTDSMAAADVL
jgi:ketosteroid isomerase-like protein|tara:strand:- start:24 stop:503 length:480 start_codon:yes stop_codon:yes gene_type:complete